MKHTRLLLFVAFLLPFSAAAQEDWSFVPTTVDVRSAAMGRTAIVSATGSNAIFSNPARLASLVGTQVQGGGRLLFGTVDSDVQDDVDISYSPHLKFDHASFAMPYRLDGSEFDLAFGIGYQTYFDWGYDLVREHEQVEIAQEISGGLNTISPAVAINFQDRYFVGLSFNKSIMSDITITQEVDYDSPDLDDPEEQETEIETSGSFIVLGAVAEFTPGLVVGLNYRSGFEWELEPEESEDTDLEIPAFWGIGGSYELSPSFTLAAEVQNRPFSDYESGGDASDIDDGYSLRFGGELRQGNLPIRFGVFRDALPTTDTGEDDPISMLGITGGIGLNFNPITIDVAAEYGTWSREVGDSDDESQNLFVIRTSVTYRFDTPTP